MKINQELRILLMSLSLSVLVGCSTVGTSDAPVADAQNAEGSAAQASGLGQNESLSNESDGSSLKVSDQTYYFDYDKSDAHASDKPSIEVQARYLASHPQAKVLLEGHTDPRGSHEYNIALGERRAHSIRQALALEGVAKNQIRLVSYGAEKLASLGHAEEDYQLDRRVHLVYEVK